MNKVKYIVVLMAVIGSLVIVKGENEAAAIDDIDRVEITQVNDAPLADTAVQTVAIVEDDSADLVELVTSEDDDEDDQGGEQTDTNELIPISSSEQQQQQQVDKTNVKSTEVDDLVKQIEDNPETEPPTEIIAEPETPQLVKKAAAVLERPIDSSLTQGDVDNNAPIGDINSDEDPKQSDSNEVVKTSNKQDVDYDDSESNSEIDNKNSDNKVESDGKVDETTTQITKIKSEENLDRKQEPIPIVDEEPKVDPVPAEEVEQHVPDTNNTDADLERDQNSKSSSVDTDKNPKNNETLIEDPIDEKNKNSSEQPQPPPEKLNTNPDTHHITDSMVKQPVNSNNDVDEKNKNTNESRTRPAGVNVFYIIIPVVCGAAVVLIIAAMILYRRFPCSDDVEAPSTSKRPIYRQVPGQEIEPASPEAQRLNA